MGSVIVADTEANAGLKAVILEAVLMKADGTVVDLGEVAAWRREDQTGSPAAA